MQKLKIKKELVSCNLQNYKKGTNKNRKLIYQVNNRHFVQCQKLFSVFANNKNSASIVGLKCLNYLFLQEPMAEIMKKYPEASAVLVRRHGVFVWGETWQKAKTM